MGPVDFFPLAREAAIWAGLRGGLGVVGFEGFVAVCRSCICGLLLVMFYQRRQGGRWEKIMDVADWVGENKVFSSVTRPSTPCGRCQ